MNDKILVERGTNLHYMISSAYVLASRKVFLTRGGKNKNKQELIKLLEEIDRIIADTYAKKYNWSKWDIGYEPCSIGDINNHNVTIFVKNSYEVF